MNIALETTENLPDAGMLVTSKNYYRRRPQKVKDAEDAHIPVYVLRGNAPPQMRQLLSSLYPSKAEEATGSFKTALQEAEEAVVQVNQGQEAVELNPQSSYIRRLQHLIAQKSDLSSRSFGKDPNRRVRIYKERTE